MRDQTIEFDFELDERTTLGLVCKFSYDADTNVVGWLGEFIIDNIVIADDSYGELNPIFRSEGADTIIDLVQKHINMDKRTVLYIIDTLAANALDHTFNVHELI